MEVEYNTGTYDIILIETDKVLELLNYEIDSYNFPKDTIPVFINEDSGDGKNVFITINEEWVSKHIKNFMFPVDKVIAYATAGRKKNFNFNDALNIIKWFKSIEYDSDVSELMFTSYNNLKIIYICLRKFE